MRGRHLNIELGEDQSNMAEVGSVALNLPVDCYGGEIIPIFIRPFLPPYLTRQRVYATDPWGRVEHVCFDGLPTKACVASVVIHKTRT